MFSLALTAPSFARNAPATPAPDPRPSDAELLRKSQVSYQAEGGFTGINSYGVLISCVNGRISVMKSVHDPRRANAFIHQSGSMTREAYLQLWRDLTRQKVLVANSVPEPKMEIADQFTVRFEAKAGDQQNEFRVHGIGRPEACQHFAIKSLIDDCTKMQAFLNVRKDSAER